VLAHEVPHHIGDLVVLRRTSGDRRAALLKVSLAGAVTPLGGFVGWWLVDRLHEYLPYFLVVASSSFIYVALADLIPQLQKRLGARETIAQIAWLLIGIGLVTVASSLAHVH
jgi:zinc and cadmium transporter